jgi:hypothetical protein
MVLVQWKKWSMSGSGCNFWKRLCIRVARFFSVQHTKTGKNVPKRGKIYQVAIKDAE